MARQTRQLVVCLKNEGYEVSLERRKIYVALSDNSAAKRRLRRVIDESGDDYLYPREFFAEVELPPSIRRAVLTTA
ncbi:MAG: hypothetical protein AABM64_15325 [Pseudomonadota bacterium]